MKTIFVDGSRPYPVNIGKGLLESVGDSARALIPGRRVCIVSDSNVWPLYGEAVAKSLGKAGFTWEYFQFPAGENSKNADTYLSLLNFCAEIKLTRSDCIIALGGGVVGDLAGFCAATYMRGIGYIQVPTSLLAMVDSSVGGKTGIDLAAGKNLVGAFYPPKAVICDTDVLQTLPDEIFRDGCSEIIKYAVLFDAELFADLERSGLDFDRETVIARCIDHKKNVVAQDEFEAGQRKLLNLGHTIGHAVERCSHYTVSHGKAVAIGLAAVCRAAGCGDQERICALISSLGLPISTDYSAQALSDAALSDKKRTGDRIEWVIPQRIGQCQIMAMDTSEITNWIAKGM